MEKTIKKQSMLNGALVLVAATMVVKIIGALYKIPLTALIGEVGRGYFNSAYEIYTPIYAISMAGLPVAVSRLVSENVALNRFRDARMIFRVALRLFIIVGIVGTLFLVGISFPYVHFSHAPGNLLSILAIAPSIFFCCIMSTYRGYYEGLRNMTPTAISQVIEAAGKLVLGIGFAKYVMSVGLNQFEAGKDVFGKAAATKADALSIIYPYAAAGAVVAVTIGTAVAMLFMIILKKFKGDAFTHPMLVNSPKPRSSEKIAKILISISIPMVISALIMNITNLVDSFTIRTRLAYAITQNMDYIKNMFAVSLTNSETLDSDIGTYLYGCYGSALDFKNLVTTITMTLGVSAIPAIAAAKALKDKKAVTSTINSVIRVAMLFAAPAGFGIAVLAEPIMSLLYGGTSAENLVPIASPIVAIYGWTTALMALSTPLTNVLQALGRPEIPAKTLAVGVIIKVVCNFIFVGNPRLNIYGATIGTVICYIVIVSLNLWFVMKIGGLKINPISTIVKPVVCAFICAFTAFTSRSVLVAILPVGNTASRLNGANISTLIAICLAMLAYAVSLLVVRGICRDDVAMLPKGEKIAKVLEKFGFLG